MLNSDNEFTAELQKLAGETLKTGPSKDWRDQAKRTEEMGEYTKQVRELESKHAEQGPSGPNADDLTWLNEQMGRTDADGKRLYYNNQKYRENLEWARRQVFEGKSIADFRRNSEADLSGKPRSDSAPAKPAVDPNASPADQLISRIEAGEAIAPSELPASLRAEATAGYTVNLPDGYGLTGDDIADLRAAREAGLTQAQVDAIVRDRLNGA